MKINGLTYNLTDAVINYRAGHIQLNSYNEAGEIVNTYPITYSKDVEIEEITEVTTTEKYIDEEIQTDKDGIDFVAKIVATRDVTKTEKTGQMIPNPQYFEPKSLVDIENWLIANHGFAK